MDKPSEKINLQTETNKVKRTRKPNKTKCLTLRLPSAVYDHMVEMAKPFELEQFLEHELTSRFIDAGKK